MRPRWRLIYMRYKKFQSTHPLRDATYGAVLLVDDYVISIHAPLTGCDDSLMNHQFKNGLFQSTHPLRDATADELKEGLYCLISIHAPLTGCDDEDILRTLNIPISIHAPLTGCDIRWRFFVFTCIYFNPRTPYGMRRKSSARNTNTVVFQSTHPLRDATV